MNVTTSIVHGDTPFLQSKGAGAMAIAIAGICFGTNFVPVKKFNMGDGIAFQWIMANAILLVGIMVDLLRGSPTFHPLAMVGGALWATGNSLTVVIIDHIGLGLGMAIWSMANLCVGFLTGRFGIFGIPPKVPLNPVLNYIGASVALLSVPVYSLIRPSTGSHADDEESSDKAGDQDIAIPLKGQEEDNVSKAVEGRRLRRRRCGLPTPSPASRRWIGVVLALIAGSFYGTTFVPTMYVQSMHVGASQNGLDYVFANFVGTWLTSTAIFIGYAVVKRNRPWVPAGEAILPSLVSGVMWALAQSSWFIANANLGEPIAFPIITTIPAFLATLLGVVVFREITGKKNLIMLAVAFALTVGSAISNGLSLVDWS